MIKGWQTILQRNGSAFWCVWLWKYKMSNNNRDQQWWFGSDSSTQQKPSGIIIIDTIDKQLKISDVEHAFNAAATTTTKTECKQQTAQRKPLGKLSSSSTSSLAQHGLEWWKILEDSRSMMVVAMIYWLNHWMFSLNIQAALSQHKTNKSNQTNSHSVALLLSLRSTSETMRTKKKPNRTNLQWISNGVFMCAVTTIRMRNAFLKLKNWKTVWKKHQVQSNNKTGSIVSTEYKSACTYARRSHGLLSCCDDLWALLWKLFLLFFIDLEFKRKNFNLICMP